MNNLIKGLLTSKKFMAAIVAMIVAAGTRYGLHLDPETVGVIIAPLIAYIVGQGMADRGKEATAIATLADINADAAERMIKKGQP